MSWTLTYIIATMLVWGKPEVGAPAFCPGQPVAGPASCDYGGLCEAWCEVASIDYQCRTITFKLNDFRK